jgi:hypothetical protein
LQNRFKVEEIQQKGQKQFHVSALDGSQQERDKMGRSVVIEDDRTVKKIKK